MARRDHEMCGIRTINFHLMNLMIIAVATWSSQHTAAETQIIDPAPNFASLVTEGIEEEDADLGFHMWTEHGDFVALLPGLSAHDEQSRPILGSTRLHHSEARHYPPGGAVDLFPSHDAVVVQVTAFVGADAVAPSVVRTYFAGMFDNNPLSESRPGGEHLGAGRDSEPECAKHIDAALAELSLFLSRWSWDAVRHFAARDTLTGFVSETYCAGWHLFRRVLAKVRVVGERVQFSGLRIR
ncbi:hypothetical protein [Wenzhouxiangella sp. XN24]|uniref:hypothetical protein n=1 Tax=Wenzhouxiangella sp. XN24 TaxID=2713569 RepID=UPI0013EC978A|nr:hypothetical protein [Wenzhouxiangella sp. XN24]NGX16585.1 hypothetical protein [Wenzhouxiangella sp. XN24]